MQSCTRICTVEHSKRAKRPNSPDRPNRPDSPNSLTRVTVACGDFELLAIVDRLSSQN